MRDHNAYTLYMYVCMCMYVLIDIVIVGTINNNATLATPKCFSKIPSFENKEK